jgi:hypothetical protein
MSAAQVPTAPATGYFVDQKKGEVNELKQVLKINPEVSMLLICFIFSYLKI